MSAFACYKHFFLLTLIIFQACSRGYSNIVNMLLKSGADPGLKRKDGWSPLDAGK